jgi:5-oxoprolinase (ATP-hydrolysing) subunit C
MIEILETPPLNTMQDLGRVGYRHHGIGRGGVMDRLALAAGNALLGNEEGEAGLEFQLFPVRLRFTQETAFAVTGADCEARLSGRHLSGRRLPSWWATRAEAGDELVLSSPRKQMRAYLTIAGGFDVPQVLGSRSTHARDSFGGYHGRALLAGDILQSRAHEPFLFRDSAGIGATPAAVAVAAAPCEDLAEGETVVRAIPAAEYETFDEASRTALFRTPWKVTARSNRQGYALSGPPLRRNALLEMRSHAIVPGVIQVPPSGQPLIQLAEANSAGGYPKIGVVIDVDLWRIGQLPPGGVLRFVWCSLAEARAAEQAAAAYLATLRRLAGYCRRTIA